MGFYEDFDSVILSPSHGGASGTIVALCFHDEEAPETSDQAENVARYFSNPAVQASTTGCIDNNSKVGCVPYGVSAWHSGAGSPWNGMIEGYEHSGYARQSREEWLDEYGIAMLEISAEHFAKRCHDLGIPVRKITPAQLNQAIGSGNPADGGICSHYDITLAAGVYGGHTDPGPNFPWDYYIDRVLFFYNGSVPEPDPEQTEDEEIMSAKDEIIAAINAAASDVKNTVVANRPPDDKWMGTNLAEGKIYIVSPDGVKYHVPGSTNPDAAQAQAENDAKIATLEFLGFDNRGVQDQALDALPEGAYTPGCC